MIQNAYPRSSEAWYIGDIVEMGSEKDTLFFFLGGESGKTGDVERNCARWQSLPWNHEQPQKFESSATFPEISNHCVAISFVLEIGWMMDTYYPKRSLNCTMS